MAQQENHTHQPIIELTNVTAGYDDKIVLRDVSLKVYSHDFLGVIGPNGGGKTTLVKLILGMKKPLSGIIKYFNNGTPTDSLTMGYLPQYNDIDRHFPISVYEVVLSGLSSQKRFLHPYTSQQREQVTETIHRMELDGMEHLHIGKLSGGQLQRVLLARAIVSRPEVVVLDEPNTYIDRRFQEQMYTLLNEINVDCSIVMVSHDVGSILQNVKDVACVNETLHYHADTEISADDLERHLGCPIELLGHGDMPHRILKNHNDN